MICPFHHLSIRIILIIATRNHCSYLGVNDDLDKGDILGTYKKIVDPHMIKVLFGLCWLVYFISYLGRLNYSSAMTVMISEFIITKVEAGFISMTYFFAYGFGQLINGFLGDKLHPGKMIVTGLVISGTANLIMGNMTGFFWMTVIWGINGYAQSMIWPPIIRIFALYLKEKSKIKCCVNIISTQAVGTLVSYLLSAFIIFITGWNAVFFAAAVCLILASIIFYIGFGKVERYAVDSLEDCYESNNSKQVAGKPKPFSAILLQSGILMILIPVIVHGILKDGVTSWVPTFISETFLTSPAFSILVTAILPLINLSGAYAAQYVYKWFKNEIKAAGLFFSLASLGLLLLCLWGNKSIILTTLLLSMITASMMAVNTLFVNLLPLRFEKSGRVSTVSGFLNSMAYLGTAVSTFTIGIVVQNYGWSVTVFIWFLITVLALLICVVFRNNKLKV